MCDVQVAQLGSVLSTVAVALERYMGVCHPHRSAAIAFGHVVWFSANGLVRLVLIVIAQRLLYYRILRPSTASWTIGLIIILSLLLNSPRFLELKTTSSLVTECNDTITLYSVEPTVLRQHPAYSSLSMLLSTLLLNLAPLSALVFLNSRINDVVKERAKLIRSSGLYYSQVVARIYLVDRDVSVSGADHLLDPRPHRGRLPVLPLPQAGAELLRDCC